mgnify:FL=1|tara:strand:- start:1585 stop:2751 length:1167 start_codon:yes stop_codon:yes gene_type:complete
MRLYVIAGSFYPEVGGPSTYLQRLLPALIKRGHQVSVITYTDHSDSHIDDHFPYKVNRITRKWPILMRLIIFVFNVIRGARDHDVLLVSDYGFPAVIANLFLRKPLVLKNVSDFAWEFSVRHSWVDKDQTIDEFQTQKHRWLVRLLRRVCVWYITKADLVIVPSKYIARLVVGWGLDREKIRVIYNALDMDLFSTLPSQSVARGEFGFARQSFLVLTVARLVSWKRIDGIMRALNHISEQCSDLQLIVVGDGPERDNLENIAKALKFPVLFTGFETQKNLFHIMRAVDVFVLFSTYEGLPHSLLEAMACSVPVIATNIGGNLEVINDGYNGLLVSVDNEIELGDKVKHVFDYPEVSRHMSACALEDLNKFSWKSLLEKTEQVLLGVID